MEFFSFLVMINRLIPGDNKRPCTLKKTYSFQRQFCLSISDLLLPPSIKSLIFMHFYQCRMELFIFTNLTKRLPSLNPFLANVPILYPLKIPDNQGFSGIFRGYKMEAFVRNGLKNKKVNKSDRCQQYAGIFFVECHFRGVFRTQSNIYDGVICKNS